jgi:hypothetical protein
MMASLPHLGGSNEKSYRTLHRSLMTRLAFTAKNSVQKIAGIGAAKTDRRSLVRDGVSDFGLVTIQKLRSPPKLGMANSVLL